MTVEQILDQVYLASFAGRKSRLRVLNIYGSGRAGDEVDSRAQSVLSSKIIKSAKLVVYKGAPHGMCTTLKDKVNAELLAFFKVEKSAAA